MSAKKSLKYLELTVAFALFFVTVAVSPKGSLDPINLPKLCALITLGSIAVGILVSNHRIIFMKIYRVPLILLSLFFIQAIFSFLIDDRDLGLKSYGIFGRNTGFLAYFFLATLLLSSMLVSSHQFIGKLTHIFIGTSSLLAIYGIIQKQGFNLYQFNNLYETNVFGTLGNPNFHSALMGMTASVVFFYGFFGVIKLSLRILLFCIGFLSMWNIGLSSEQGYLVFLAGLTSGLIIFLIMKRKIFFALSILSTSILGGLLVGLGLFNLGPVSGLLYGSSIEARRFYWRAAVNLILDHPLFGIGFDAYGDWYRRGRTLDIAQFNPGIVSDSAHNIPLDIGVSGGFPLLFAYLAVQAYVLISIIKTIRKSREIDIHFTIAVIIWTGYQVQSLISINSLGVGIWGWVMSGLLIGYCIRLDTSHSKVQTQSNLKIDHSKVATNWQQIFLIFITGIIGISIAIAPYRAANHFLSALKTQNEKIIIASASLKPFDRYRFLYVVDIMNQNQKYSVALKLLNKASKLYPDSYEIWTQISINPTSSQDQVARAKSQLRRLDPWNPEQS